MAPRVSVVMPVYNGERFIAEAVRSVLASEFRDYELLILDDGSTDGSVAVVRRVAGDDARVRIIVLPHGGIAATRNAGLEHSRADYIANLDSDDAMFPHRLALQVAYLDAHPECVAVGSRSVVVDADSKAVGMVGRYITHENIDRSLLEGNGGAIGNDSAMVRKKAAIAVGGYAPQLQTSGEDHDMWLRLAEAGRLVCLPDVLNRYRIHQSNTSLGEGSKERRLPVTLDNLARAFARRGITGREPVKVSPTPMSAGEKARDNALTLYYQGDRRGAAMRIVTAAVAHPRTPAIANAVLTIIGAAPPTW
ncbi:MAG: glycosyl transferase family 2 [Gemmatimonadetes bacterium]|nr:glycosyl transferase family 2 [Gemmatimonadota bacterium]